MSLNNPAEHLLNLVVDVYWCMTFGMFQSEGLQCGKQTVL